MIEPLYLLDTNICIYVLGGRGLRVRRRFEAHRRGELVTSAIVRAEVMLGAKRHDQLGRAEAFFEQVETLPFTAEAADVFSNLPYHRGNLDHLIAAHAMLLDLTLVTNNEKDFDYLPGLRVENWTKA